jgi:uncharacterized protein YecE (DUF72 family)
VLARMRERVRLRLLKLGNLCARRFTTSGKGSTACGLRNKIAPAAFIFAVKGSRFITHIKRLREPDSAVALFFSRVQLLREKLGPILFQLPPNWGADIDRLQEFLATLPPGASVLCGISRFQMVHTAYLRSVATVQRSSLPS